MGRIPKVEKERALQLHQVTSSSSSPSSPPSSLSAAVHTLYHATVSASSQSQPYDMNDCTSLTAVNGNCAEKGVMDGLPSADAESSRNGCLQETDDNVQHARGSNWVSVENCACNHRPI